VNETPETLRAFVDTWLAKGTWPHRNGMAHVSAWDRDIDGWRVALNDIVDLKARIETLEPLAAYGEKILRQEYKDEAGIESILSATRGIKSSHRSYEAFKTERFATLT
jgi:hypothetical protein